MDVLPGLFDTISHHGPLAGCADDARLFLAATQGPDDADILSIPGPLDLAHPLEPDVAGLRLALSIDLGCWAVHPEIAAAVDDAANRLGDTGAVVERVDLQLTEHDAESWDVLWGVFMAAYFGHLVAEFGDRMDPDVLSLIDAGNRVSASDYKRLELVRTDLWGRLRAVLAGHDALLCPTMAAPPLPAAKADRPPGLATDDEGYHSPVMTEVFNLVSPCPALSVPCGYHRDPEHAGLPIGLQVVGRRWREDTVLRVAKAVEAQDS
jgi:Asp-tRNA(Asn)/Glu-tRNA(Gln) amidotransferase A subunit family amidase